MTTTISASGRIAGAIAALAIATALPAQTAPEPETVADSQTPDAGLDLPDNLEIFGNADPDIRKPTAIVNNHVITGTDVDQRLAMVQALNGLDIANDKQRQQLRLQTLRSLIDETLEIQEAKANEITVSDAEVDQGYQRLAKRFDRSPEKLNDYLAQSGASAQTLRRQIEGELAWRRLLQRRVDINIGDEEVQAILQRMKDSKGTEEYHLKEIFLRANGQDDDQVFQKGQKIIAQMKEGAPFEYFARTQSDATTRAVGGDLDWIRPATLPPALAGAVKNMQIGQVAGPIEIPGGFSILYLVDTRQILTADPRDAVLSLRQMTIDFPQDTSEQQVKQRAAKFAEATQAMQGCGAVDDTAAKLDATVVDNDSIRIRDLPPQLQDIMLKMKVGQATPPFGSPAQGVRVLVLCGRDDPKTASLPSPERIREARQEKRTNLRAQRMLRDLRRDAIIEYR